MDTDLKKTMERSRRQLSKGGGGGFRPPSTKAKDNSDGLDPSKMKETRLRGEGNTTGRRGRENDVLALLFGLARGLVKGLGVKRKRQKGE